MKPFSSKLITEYLIPLFNYIYFFLLIVRAKLYGWSNTYTYTKAMGEMLLGQFNQNLPLVIIRPTMVTSTYKEPFSGWIEGTR